MRAQAFALLRDPDAHFHMLPLAEELLPLLLPPAPTAAVAVVEEEEEGRGGRAGGADGLRLGPAVSGTVGGDAGVWVWGWGGGGEVSLKFGTAPSFTASSHPSTSPS